jgi:hypothetical protein
VRRRPRAVRARPPVCDGVAGRLRYELRLTWLGGARILERVERTGAAHPSRRRSQARLPLSVARRALGGRGCMARKTSFYYSFLVLPAEQRRAIIAVWDFCRAWTMRWTRSRRSAAALPTGAAPSRSGATSWRAASTAARRDRQGRACSRSSRSSICRGRRSRMSSTAWRWTSTRTRYETFDDLFEYCRASPRRSA